MNAIKVKQLHVPQTKAQKAVFQTGSGVYIGAVYVYPTKELKQTIFIL